MPTAFIIRLVVKPQNWRLQTLVRSSIVGGKIHFAVIQRLWVRYEGEQTAI